MNRVSLLLMAMLLTISCSAILLCAKADAGQRRVALKEFQAHPGAIRFNGVSDRHDMFIPVYNKDFLRSIELELQYINSAALIPGISQLTVQVDGFTVGQIGLTPSRPEGRARIDIPVELLNADTMRLTLKVIQHYDRECEAPDSEQLWTEINPVKSALTFDYSDTSQSPTLRRWVNMFSPDNPFLSKATIVVPEASIAWLRAASSVSSWLAKVRNFRPLQFDVKFEFTPESPNIILGPRDFIEQTLERAVAVSGNADSANTLPASLPGRIEGPVVGTLLVPRPGKKPTFCLIVSGTTAEQAANAARRLAVVLQNWPENDWLSLAADPSWRPPEFRRDCLRPGISYTLKKLGLYGDMLFQGLDAQERALTLHIPPEIFRQENLFVKLTLDLVYAAGLREDSTLLIKINGTLAGSIPLDDPKGKTFTDYMVKIPMSFFKAGHNLLSFKAVMKPFRAYKCTPLGQEGMATAILGSSEITIPEGHEYYRLPELALVMDDMFPYSLAVEKKNPPTLLTPEPGNIYNFEAAVNFAALFARRLKSSVAHFSITDGLPENPGNDIIFIGALDKLPKTVKQALPLFGAPHPLAYLFPRKKKAVLAAKNQFSDTRLLITEFEYPDGSGKTALIIAAMKNETVDSGLRLINGPVANRLSGDTALVDVKTGEVKTYHMNRQFQVGHIGIQGKTGNWLVSRPEYYYPLLAIVVLITALIARALIRRRRKIRNDVD